MRYSVLTALTIFLISVNVLAQHQGHTSEYAGEERRVIKSLSESDIEELKAGKGWGFAKAAELNGYPGPSHVLEMKEEIGLTGEQTLKVQELFNRMQAQAVIKGEVFIDAENTLSEAFDDQNVDVKVLDELVMKAAKARGELRLVHLSAHLELIEILTTEQVEKYNELRGYNNSDPCENIPEGHNPELWKKHNNCSE
jgi:Spy/CpxP family protein refolding chaperone